ncbi:hypothetical protein GCM10027199_16660 [Amycolatopsis magusensis]
MRGRGEVVEEDGLVARLGELVGDVGADEPGAAGEEYSHAGHARGGRWLRGSVARHPSDFRHIPGGRETRGDRVVRISATVGTWNAVHNGWAVPLW